MELARRFSLHIQGAPLIYNLLLAEMRYDKQLSMAMPTLIERYRGELAEWASWEAEEQYSSRTSFGTLVMRSGRPAARSAAPIHRELGGGAGEHGPAAVADSEDLRHLVRTREQQLKGQPGAGDQQRPAAGLERAHGHRANAVSLAECAAVVGFA